MHISAHRSLADVKNNAWEKRYFWQGRITAVGLTSHIDTSGDRVEIPDVLSQLIDPTIITLNGMIVRWFQRSGTSRKDKLRGREKPQSGEIKQQPSLIKRPLRGENDCDRRTRFKT